MSEVSSRGDAGGCTSRPSNSLDKVARCEALTTDGSTPWSERVSGDSEQLCAEPFLHHRARLIHKVLRFCEAGCSYPPVWTATAGPPPSGVPWPQAEGPTVLGSCQGPSGFLGKGGVAAPGLRPRGFAARASRVSCPRPDRTNKDSLLGSADGGPMASGTKPGAMGFPRQRRLRRAWSSGSWRTTPRPAPNKSHPQMLRFCQAGHYCPVWTAQTGTSPPGAPWATNRDPRVPGSTEEPPWIPRQGRRDEPQALVCGEPAARVSSPSIPIE
jgi:hypothetical protein